MKNDVDIALRLWVVMTRAVNSISERLRKQVESHGLSLTEFGVLEVLYHKGEMPIGMIGEKVLLTSGSMTYVIDKLEQRGLLERAACPNDKRVTWARLTEEGRGLMDQVFPEHAGVIASLMSSLDRTETEEAARVMKRLGLYAQDRISA